MYKEALLKFYGSVAATAQALGVGISAVYQWKTVVPERIALKAQHLSGGHLKVDAALYPPKGGKRRVA